MKISDFEVFLSVAEEGSFIGASRKLYVSQSAVTQAIKKTETELGFPLFERNTHSVFLTPQGNVMKAAAETIIRTYREAISESVRIGDGQQSVVIYYIGTISLRSLPRILGKYRKDYPNTAFKTFRIAPDRVRYILEHEPDAWIFIPRYLLPDNMRVHFYPLYSDWQYCVMNRAHRLAAFSELEYSDLYGSSILLPSNMPEHLRLVYEKLEAPELRCQFVSGENLDNVIMNLLSSDAHIAIMPGYTRPVHPDLISIPFHSGIQIEVGIAAHHMKSEREKAFLEAAKDVLNTNIP